MRLKADGPVYGETRWSFWVTKKLVTSRIAAQPMNRV